MIRIKQKPGSVALSDHRALCLVSDLMWLWTMCMYSILQNASLEHTLWRIPHTHRVCSCLSLANNYAIQSLLLAASALVCLFVCVCGSSIRSSIRILTRHQYRIRVRQHMWTMIYVVICVHLRHGKITNELASNKANCCRVSKYFPQSQMLLLLNSHLLTSKYTQDGTHSTRNGKLDSLWLRLPLSIWFSRREGGFEQIRSFVHFHDGDSDRNNLATQRQPPTQPQLVEISRFARWIFASHKGLRLWQLPSIKANTTHA